MLAALTCLLFLPALNPDTSFYFRDFSQNHHPYRVLTVSQIERGEAPLWNPLRGTGQPLLANPNALILHPTTLLFLVFPLGFALKLSVIGQIFLAAAGTWLLLRDLGASRGASILGAALFAFSGPVVSMGNLLNLLDTTSFMPLTLWLARRGIARGFTPWGALAALPLSVQILSGEPALLVCTGLALVGLHWSSNRPVGSVGVRVARFAAIAGLAMAVAMIGVLPTVELLSRSERGEGFGADEAMKWSLPPKALVEVVLPGVLGDPTRIGVSEFWGGGLYDSGLPFLLGIHIGAGGLLLALIGVLASRRGSRLRRREAGAFTGLVLAGGALALGRFLPLYPLLLTIIPPLASVRYPSKYFLLAAWGISLLAARGYDAVTEPVVKRRPVVLGAAILGTLTVATGALLLVLLPGWLELPEALVTPEGAQSARSALLVSLLIALVQIAGVIGLSLWTAGYARSLGLAVILIGTSLYASFPLNPVAPSRFYEEEPTVAVPLGDPGGGRIWAQARPAGFAFATPEGVDGRSLLWGFRWDRMTLRNATGFPLEYRFAYDRGNERLDLMPGGAIGRKIRNEATDPLTLKRYLSIAGVDRLLAYQEIPGFETAMTLTGASRPRVRILRNSDALPRVTIRHEAEVIPSTDDALKRLVEPGFDPQEVVVLDQRHPLPLGRPGVFDSSRARIVEESAGDIRISASLHRPGYLLLNDSYYPGWTVTVDGEEEEILRANTMFRAVPLGAGAHEIIFTYSPATVRNGLIVSLMALLLVVLLGRPRAG